MAPWLLRYPRCPKRALHFLHLASHPLAINSSYSGVTVSSIFCPQNIKKKRSKCVGPRFNLEAKRDSSSAYVKDENGVLLGDVELIRERWVRWFHTLFNAKSPRLGPNIARGLDQWPENMPLEVQPTMQELTDAIRSLAI